MLRTLRCGLLFIGFALLVASATSYTQGQDKKDKKDKKKVGPAIEATEKTGKDWLIRPAGPNLQMVTDKKDYIITALPKDLMGSTYLMRTAADHGQWLPDGSVKAKEDGTVFAMIRVRYNNKDAFSADQQKQLEKDGWTAVEGKAATTSPGKENWEWKIWKQDIKAGEVNLKLENLKWPGTAVLFFFK